MTASVMNVNGDETRLRVSVIARLITALAYTIPAIGGAAGSFILMNVFRSLRTAETAGISSVMKGMEEAALPVTVSLYLAALFGVAVVIVLAILMFVRTTTDSPPFWFYVVGGILCLIPAMLFWKAQLLVIEVLSPGSPLQTAGVSGVAADLSRLLLVSIAAAPIVFIVLVVLSVLPFRSRSGRKWGGLFAAIVITTVFAGAAIAVPFLIDGPKRKKEMVSLPADVPGADSDHNIDKETSVVITLTSDNKLYRRSGRDSTDHIGAADTVISNQDLPQALERGLEGKTPDQRIVYFKCDTNASYENVLQVLQTIRNADVDEVGLVVIGEKNENDPYQISPEDFEVRLPAEVKQSANVRPNPLLLLARLDSNGRLALNYENLGTFADSSILKDRLSEVFKEREGNGVFREGTNEVEKTVFLQLPKSSKYGDLIKLVEALKLSGADPIMIQIDDDDLIGRPDVWI
jgi:biopolymer transport protein ExbD